jgi:hypothetical protein
MNCGEFLSSLFEITVVTHIAHLQTSSFSEHKALGELYDGLEDQLDAYAEAYQGEYGIVKGYKDFKLSEGEDMVSYLKKKADEIEKYRGMLTEGYLQQLVDNMLELIKTTIYKLRFLS